MEQMLGEDQKCSPDTGYTKCNSVLLFTKSGLNKTFKKKIIKVLYISKWQKNIQIRPVYVCICVCVFFYIFFLMSHFVRVKGFWDHP